MLQSPMGLLPGRQEPDVAIRTLRQAVGPFPTDEDNFKVAESLLKQSPDSKTSNPTRQLKRAYAAMLQAVKEQHLAEKEHLIQVPSWCKLYWASHVYLGMAVVLLYDAQVDKLLSYRRLCQSFKTI